MIMILVQLLILSTMELVMSKKVWFVFCEGDTDKLFINHCHKLLENYQVRIVAYKGDFLTDHNNNNVTPVNVINQLDKYLKGRVNSELKGKKLKVADIDKVIYMTDTDACFEQNSYKSVLLRRLVNKNELKIRQNLVIL